jgi:hypothetical protein
MRMRNLLCALRLLVLASALGVAGEVAAQSYHFSISGAPSNVICTPTSITTGPGIVITWNLPPGTLVRSIETINEWVEYEDVFVQDPPAGSFAPSGDVTTWPTPIALPYTFATSITPLIPGAGTSSASFDCVGGFGTNFRISNAPPFTLAGIPTLTEWALAALVAILGALSLLVLRRRA